MNNASQQEPLPFLNELNGELRDAVQQACLETHADESLQRALDRACQLDSPAPVAEVERQNNSHVPSVSPRSRHHHGNRSAPLFARIAAIVVAVAAVTGLLNLFTPGGSSAAFAQVQQSLDRIRSVTFDLSSQSPGQPQTTSRVYVWGANRVRVELPDGEYWVHDSEAEKSLIVRQPARTAVVIVGRQPGTTAHPADLYNSLRRIHSDAVEQLPGRSINGTAATGFQVIDQQRTLKVWVDPVTDLPLYIESTRRQPDGMEVVETGSNFIFDSKLDESLFGTDPPSGFDLETRTYPKKADSKQAESKLVITPKIGLGPARFGMTQEEIVKVLGQPDYTQASPAGQTLRYDSRGFWITFGPDGKLSNIACHAYPASAAPVARTFAGKLSDGITMGASRKGISQILGPPNYLDERDSKFGKTTRMSYWDLALDFTLRDDSLVEIHAHRPKAEE